MFGGLSAPFFLPAVSYLRFLPVLFLPQQLKQPNLQGRYYHVNELATVCPCDWRLPDPEDWINYFDYLAKATVDSTQVQLSTDKSHIAFHEYSDDIDLFAPESPLQLIPTGRFEGGEFILPKDYADYWTHDPPNFGPGDRNERPGVVIVIPEVEDGKTHIHMRQKGFTNIHSHKHHLDPDKEKKLRKFMVRCVK